MSELLRATEIAKTYTLWRKPSDRLVAPAVATVARLCAVAPSLHRRLVAKSAALARPFAALQPLSFTISRGQSLGIIGRNGSGKSTLLQILAGTLTPSGGSVERNGRLAALLELGSGFNFEFTGRENVYLQAAIYGVPAPAMTAHFEEVANFADIGAFIDQPVKTYSSGMMVRLAFAVQVVLRPDVLIVDEALAVGDIFFQAKCAAYFRERLAEGMSLIFVSHDLVSVKALCREAIVLHQGAVQFHGDSKEAVNVYHELHSTAARQSVQRSATPSEPAAQLHRNWESSDEIGTREAELMMCEVLDETDQRRREFSEGESIRVRLHVRSHAAIPQLHAAFQIVDRHNRALYGVSTLHRGHAGISVAVGEAALLEIELPGRLGPGKYLLDVALGWGDRGDGAFQHQCHRVGGIASISVSAVQLKPRFLGPVDLAAHLEWRHHT